MFALFRTLPKSSQPAALRALYPFLLLLCSVGCYGVSYAQELETVVDELQQRYEHIETITGNYEHTYRGPGIDQFESGTFWLKKPGLMRLECNDPEEKLFVADGRESFHYVPLDHQVYIQQFTAKELRDTPLGLLLGAEDIYENYNFSWEEDFKPKFENTHLIRLKSRKNDQVYSFVALELDQKTGILRRILVREDSGSTSEYLLTNLATNVKIENDRFRFRVPKGVEVIQMTDD
jgi:outer membrane lipoprotein carrier protein